MSKSGSKSEKYFGTNNKTNQYQQIIKEKQTQMILPTLNIDNET